MFCQYCGSQVSDYSNNCPNCGSPLRTVSIFEDAPQNNFVNNSSSADDAGNRFGNSVNEIAQDYAGQNYSGQNSSYNESGYGGTPYGGPAYAGMRLQTDRNIIILILLSMITCGIYSYYFIYKLAHDVNVACEGDGERTAGLLEFILLSFVTCGIYSFVWYYKLGDRLYKNAPRYFLNFTENGSTILLWMLLGSMLCGVGPLVAINIIITNTNKICKAYNSYNGL